MYRILEQQGLKPMDSMEKPFDTEYHDAITNIPAPTEELKGKVVDVAEKGYFFNDTVLRHAKVIDLIQEKRAGMAARVSA